MRRSLKNPFYRKCDLLLMVGLDTDKSNYKLFRRMLSEEIAQKTGYDQKHTFTEVEKDVIIKYFKN